MRKVLIGLIMQIVAVCSVYAAEPVRIVAFGDSLVHGYGLPSDAGFVPQMQKWLDGQGISASLTNAGVSGDTTAGGAARVSWTLGDGFDAMIVVLGGNDTLRGLDPAQTRSNLNAILTEAESHKVAVLFVGMQAPGNFGADYKTKFDSLYPDLAAAHDVVFFPYYFAGIADRADNPAQLRLVMQGDGIHPNADGVAAIVAAMGPSVVELITQVRR
ncbi:arylesterase [Rhodobacteraceae bacterium M382]|nr:arylesterase [Rhodobacteraceae bacterium M382]